MAAPLVQPDYMAQKGLNLACRTAASKGTTYNSDLLTIKEVDDVLGTNEVLITQIPEDCASSVYERGREEESVDSDPLDQSELHSGRRLDLHVSSDGGLVLSIGEQDLSAQSILKSHSLDCHSLQSSDDEDYETDLEFDEERWLNPDGRDHDTTGKNKYIKVCQDLGVSPVSYFLRHIQDKEMVMKFHGLGKNNTKALCIPLETNTEIEKLNLSGNGIDADGAISLIRVLKENFFITDLVLSENRIGSVGARAVCDLLLSNKTLVNVDLTGNKIGDNTAKYFHSVLIKNQTLKHLHLNHNKFEESGAQYFKEALLENESLEVLDLSWNHFGTRGCVLLAEGLQENVGLKYLSLSMAGLGREGAEAIGKALKHNRSLLELDITYSRIQSDGVCFLSAGMKENDVLQVLKMGFNPFDADSAMCMLQALEQNESSAVHYLDLSNCLVKREFVELLDKLVSLRPGLHVIYEGILPECQYLHSSMEEMVKFRQEPVSMFNQLLTSHNMTLSDLFTTSQFLLTQDEFRKTFKNFPDLPLNKEQVNVLYKKLNIDGMVDIRRLQEEEETDQHKDTDR